MRIAVIVMMFAACKGERHDPLDDPATYTYDLVDHTDPARAVVAIDRLFDHRVTSRIAGNTLDVTFPTGHEVLDDMQRMDDVQRGTQTIEVRQVDYDSPYLNALASYLRGNDRAIQLEVTPGLDSFGRSVRVPDSAEYVNESWAKAHGCTSDRMVGSGYRCWIPPRVRFAAIVSGDPDLFVDPLPAELATPPGRAWFPAPDTGEWRFYLTYDPPMRLDGDEIASVDERGVVLTSRGVALLAERAGGSAVQLAVVFDGALLPARHDGTRLAFSLDDKDAARIRRGLPFAGVHLRLAR